MKGNSKGMVIGVVVVIVLFAIMIGACSGSSSSSRSYSGGSSYSGSSGSSNKRNGYDMPNEGESFSDYVKRVDPGLYQDMTDIYNSAKNNP